MSFPFLSRASLLSVLGAPATGSASSRIGSGALCGGGPAEAEDERRATKVGTGPAKPSK